MDEAVVDVQSRLPQRWYSPYRRPQEETEREEISTTLHVAKVITRSATRLFTPFVDFVFFADPKPSLASLDFN